MEENKITKGHWLLYKVGDLISFISNFDDYDEDDIEVYGLVVEVKNINNNTINKQKVTIFDTANKKLVWFLTYSGMGHTVRLFSCLNEQESKSRILPDL